MCISTVVIDNEHLRLGSLALRAEEERKTDDSAKKKDQQKTTNKHRFKRNFCFGDILEMLLLSGHFVTLVRKY